MPGSGTRPGDRCIVEDIPSATIFAELVGNNLVRSFAKRASNVEGRVCAYRTHEVQSLTAHAHVSGVYQRHTPPRLDVRSSTMAASHPGLYQSQCFEDPTSGYVGIRVPHSQSNVTVTSIFLVVHRRRRSMIVSAEKMGKKLRVGDARASPTLRVLPCGFPTKNRLV